MKRLFALVVIAVALAGCSAFPWPLPGEIDGQAGITDDRALEIARAAAPDAATDGEVLDLHRTTYGEVADAVAPVIEGPKPAPDDCAIVVNLGHDEGSGFGEGAHVILDCDSGRVLHVWPWAS